MQQKGSENHRKSAFSDIFLELSALSLTIYTCEVIQGSPQNHFPSWDEKRQAQDWLEQMQEADGSWIWNVFKLLIARFLRQDN